MLAFGAVDVAAGTEELVELRRLAEQGDADAQFKLGFMYDNGEGVPEDDTEAVKWFRMAAEQRHPKAQSNLASSTPLARACPKTMCGPMPGTI